MPPTANAIAASKPDRRVRITACVSPSVASASTYPRAPEAICPRLSLCRRPPPRHPRGQLTEDAAVANRTSITPPPPVPPPPMLSPSTYKKAVLAKKEPFTLQLRYSHTTVASGQGHGTQERCYPCVSLR